jgi:hypothetical protein
LSGRFEDVSNGLSINGLVLNGLRMNGLRMNGLRMNGLSLNGLVLNGTLSLNGLDEAESYNVMTYVVGCALPEGHQITIYGATAGETRTAYRWSGALGLGPELEWSALSDQGQRAVSSCLLAHANSAGKHVLISIRGAGIPVTDEEMAGYTYPDGTFWGNLFTEPAELSACEPDALTASDASVLQQMGRDCDIPIVRDLTGARSACGIQIVGPCASFCHLAFSNGDGSYSDCHNEMPPISVFLPPLPPAPASEGSGPIIAAGL